MPGFYELGCRRIYGELIELETGCCGPFIFSVSYGGVRCYMKEFRDLGDWQP